jgi:hypothetical protein
MGIILERKTEIFVKKDRRQRKQKINTGYWWCGP